MTSPKDLFRAIGDEPERPLTSSREVLDRVRRSARRRSHAQALLGAFVLLLIVGGAVLVMPRVGSDGMPFQPAAPQITATFAPSTPAPPSAPSSKAADAHSDSVGSMLMRAVPAGYGAEPATLTGLNTGHVPVTYAWQVDIAKGHYRSTSLVRVTKDGGVGMLMATIGNDGPSAWNDNDSCRSALNLGIEGATDLTCGQVVVDGVRIRVVSGHDPGLGQVIAAVRFIRGGYAEVVFSQGLRAYQKHTTSTGSVWLWTVNSSHEPVLASTPLTARQIAQIAADDDLLP